MSTIKVKIFLVRVTRDKILMFVVYLNSVCYLLYREKRIKGNKKINQNNLIKENSLTVGRIITDGTNPEELFINRGVLWKTEVKVDRELLARAIGNKNESLIEKLMSRKK